MRRAAESFRLLAVALQVELELARCAATIALEPNGWKRLSIADIERLAKWVR